MPFNGDPIDFIPYARENPNEIQEQLETWAWEWLETNCASWRWWQPTRRTLAEIFGVPTGHEAGDVARAYAHFDANPKDLNIADVTEKGERGEVNFSILRSPHSDNYIAAHGKDAGSFWAWFQYLLAKLAAKLDNRVVQVLRSVYARIDHHDLSSAPVSTSQLKAMSILIPERAGWLIHSTAASRITDGPLNSTTMGSPVVVVSPPPPSLDDPDKVTSDIFVPSTCLVRSERLGHHFAVADSMRCRIDITSDTEATIDLDLWTGVGLDITTGKVKAVGFDLGVKEGI